VKRKAQIGRLGPRHSAPSPISDELRRWIDQVIVPILVAQYLGEKGLQEGETSG